MCSLPETLGALRGARSSVHCVRSRVFCARRVANRFRAREFRSLSVPRSRSGKKKPLKAAKKADTELDEDDLARIAKQREDATKLAEMRDKAAAGKLGKAGIQHSSKK